ncbi:MULTISPECIES: hypothetical protein [Acinetobacter]|uniref:hypothetical protein n=1 Tax=Acinetobacter TaxID=469 RepID=UPI002586AF22|nr:MULTISPECIES: hypothetical protein [Acinetobacter]
MYDADKLKFKLKLGLSLIFPEDIQKWAIEQLADDSNNLLALEICFLSNEQQVLDYFLNIHVEHLSIALDLKNKIYYEILVDYAETQPTSEYSKDIILCKFMTLFEISKYIENEGFADFIDYYDDEFYLSSEGFSQLEPHEVWSKFLYELKNRFI